MSQAQYMGKLTPEQNQAVQDWKLDRYHLAEPPTPDYLETYRYLTDAMGQAADEMMEAARHNDAVHADDVAMAQCHAAHALDQAINALEHAQIVLHV